MVKHIALTEEEIAFAIDYARKVYEYKRSINAPSSYGNPISAIPKTSSLGYQGKIACAKALDIIWFPPPIDLNTRIIPDFANIKVRTRKDHNYDLLIHPDDDDELCYVHVTKSQFEPKFKLWGWMKGSDAKNEKWFRALRTGRPKCYLIPATELNLMESL